MWSVEVELIAAWVGTLDEDSRAQVFAALRVLEEMGPALGRPLVDTVRASRHKNLKELRPGSSGKTEIRLLFAFDPERRAIVLLGGDKAGQWSKWYRVNIPKADDLFDEHLERLKKEGGGHGHVSG